MPCLFWGGYIQCYPPLAVVHMTRLTWDCIDAAPALAHALLPTRDSGACNTLHLGVDALPHMLLPA